MFHILSAKSSTKAIVKCDAEIVKVWGVGDNTILHLKSYQIGSNLENN